jgi:hypothetical protein
MHLNRISLSIITFIGLASTVACNDKLAVSAKEEPAASVSDTDTTDETATSAPPADEAENPGAPPGAGDVWERGVWRYEGGHYLWNRGRWEHARPGFALIQARWVEDHGKWVRHPCRWEKGGEGRPNEGHEGKPGEHDRPGERR